MNDSHPDTQADSQDSASKPRGGRRNGKGDNRLTRAFAYSLFILLLIAVLSLWQRDRQILRYWNNRMDNQFAELLRESTKDWGTIPLQFPANSFPGKNKLENMYLSMHEVKALRSHPDSVIVGVSNQVNRLLGADGYFVVTYEKGHYRTIWMSPGDLAVRYKEQRSWVEDWYASRKSARLN